MYTAPVPVGEGSLWDELMGLVDPEQVTPEPTFESQSVKAGRFNDDGTYDQHGDRGDPFAWGSVYQVEICELSESDVLQENARAVLHEVGFVIIEEGGTDMFKAMGGVIQADDPIQAIYRNL
jgi:hypothetical protein